MASAVICPSCAAIRLLADQHPASDTADNINLHALDVNSDLVARGQPSLSVGCALPWSAEVAVDGLAGDVECLGDARDGVDPLAVGVLSFNAKMKFRTVTAQTRIGAVA